MQKASERSTGGNRWLQILLVAIFAGVFTMIFFPERITSIGKPTDLQKQFFGKN